ncbi:MAG: HU family DNA-binding protein [Clostridia bacterium]|nr:HU family DNA-binding protein [Clostridia bacterium]
MNKTDLITCISKKAGLTKKDSEKALEAFVATVQEGLAEGKKISLAGFGTFYVKERKERAGIDPQTREPISISAKKAPAFKISRIIKRLVAEQ